MRHLMTTIFAVGAVLVSLCAPAKAFASAAALQPVNAVLGDESFIKTFGYQPTATTDDKLRIQTHLAYVEQLLRQRDVSHLPQTAQAQRRRLLDKLHEYWLAGRFPKNLDCPNERRPCFIDKFGNICAVGYLVEQSAGRGLAEIINARHKYDYIKDMNEPELLQWVEHSGLTLEECAMIQPQYGPPTPILEITPTVISITGATFSFLVRYVDPYEQQPYAYNSSNLSIKTSDYVIISTTSAWGTRFPTSSVRLSVTIPTFTQSTNTYIINLYAYVITFGMGPEPIICTIASNTVFLGKRVYATTSVQSPSTEDAPSLSLYPNPANDVVHFDVPSANSAALSATLYDMAGMEVRNIVLSAREHTLNVSSLAPGVYFLEVNDGKKRQRTKFVKN